MSAALFRGAETATRFGVEALSLWASRRCCALAASSANFFGQPGQPHAIVFEAGFFFAFDFRAFFFGFARAGFGSAAAVGVAPISNAGFRRLRARKDGEMRCGSTLTASGEA